MLDTLFGLIPAASRGQQWVADELQLINWGGYDGYHRVKFSPSSTLLCGGSGSGKSTLMDAYIALMMPHTTPFNGASNGGVVGRPRGQDQRNILSYARGKLDETRTDSGTKVRVLRGDGVDTWTAVAMTWLDHDGSRFTAVRAWYVPATAKALENTFRVRASVDGDFDLRTLEQAASQRLTDSALHPLGLQTFDTDREFSARLQSVLGIGAAGSGAKAMSLLARVQAGQQITTVDELYKRMVLEEPETMGAADAVVAHFDGLESTREQMITARQQVATLEPISGLRAKLEASAERLRIIEEVGDFAESKSLAALWRANRRLELLRSAEDEYSHSHQRATAIVKEKTALVKAARIEQEGLADVLRAAGGDRMETARRELRDAELRLERMAGDRARLDAALKVLDAHAEDAKQFDKLRGRAQSATQDQASKGEVLERHSVAAAVKRRVAAELNQLKDEYHEAEQRDGNIPRHLQQAREVLAETAGIPIDELPFVGELIEVRTEFEPWRQAFNLALGGFVTTLLIDVAKVDQFRAAINSAKLPTRVNFQGVETGIGIRELSDDRVLPGRLDYRKTKFTGWLQLRLQERFDFVCVDQASQLGKARKALTITGQMADGNRGAHGGHGRDNAIGFSNRRRLADLNARIKDAELRLGDAIDETDAAKDKLEALDEQRSAWATVLSLGWDQVDVAGVEAQRDRWLQIIDEVTAGNPKIAELRTQLDQSKAKADRLVEEVGRAKQDVERVAEKWSLVTDQVDAAGIIIEVAEEEGIVLQDAQRSYLDEEFSVIEERSGANAGELLSRFDAALERASQRFAEHRAAAQETLIEARETLRRTLVTFLDRWPNPNLLPDPDSSVADFEAILAELKASGLHELEGEWRDSLLRLSGNDLTSLDSTLGRALREIRERIEPINEIMRDLPFYDDDHRLQISTHENQSTMRQRFRKELRQVRGLLDEAETDEQREAAYVRMSKLINRIRRSSPEFADLIDVRNHVRVSAERVTAQGREHVSLYDHIGEKSGGESQELIAFIVGAALRYQLGDPGAERPRYAPVFLDEALIKADAHFTRRAIGAWQGLGFQLIIGAPNDKYSAIEPHIDVEYDILKDTHGRSWAKPKVALS